MSKFENIILKLGKNVILIKGYDEAGCEYVDEMILNFTEEVDKSYIFVSKQKSQHVINWFEEFDLSGAEEITLKEGYYSTLDTIAELYENQEAKAVFEKYFSQLVDHEKFKAMMSVMSIDAMSKLSHFRVPKELLLVINKELNAIKKG